jgi:hypothetical protein
MTRQSTGASAGDGAEAVDAEGEVRERAAVVIQRYAGMYLERKYVALLKAKKREEEAEAAVDALKARFRVAQRPALHQLCFDLETQQNNAMFQSMAPLSGAAKRTAGVPQAVVRTRN